MQSKSVFQPKTSRLYKLPGKSHNYVNMWNKASKCVVNTVM